MRSPTSLHETRVYSPENFWSPLQKDFCNTIGTNRTFLPRRPMSAYRGQTGHWADIAEWPSLTDGVDKVGNLKGASAYSVWRLELVSFSLPLLKRAATLT